MNFRVFGEDFSAIVYEYRGVLFRCVIFCLAVFCGIVGIVAGIISGSFRCNMRFVIRTEDCYAVCGCFLLKRRDYAVLFFAEISGAMPI